MLIFGPSHSQIISVETVAENTLFVYFVFLVMYLTSLFGVTLILADELQLRKSGSRSQYLWPDCSQFVFYLAHAAISLVAEYQLRQLLLQSSPCLFTNKVKQKVK